MRLLLEFKVLVMIRPQWTPFLPAFTIRSGQDGPKAKDIQIMPTASFTGEGHKALITHNSTPSIHWQYPVVLA